VNAKVMEFLNSFLIHKSKDLLTSNILINQSISQSINQSINKKFYLIIIR